MSDWTLAKADRIVAVRDATGQLIIGAFGKKPTPCYTVKIVQRPELIFPPRFAVTWREGAGPCPDVVTPYAVHSDPFAYPSNQETVLVFTADGDQVVHIEPAVMPAPVFADPAGEGAPTLDTAVGFSSTFSFEEALNSAIRNLPPRASHIADELVSIQVTGIGAQIGGIAGLHRLVVRVLRAS